MSEGLFGVNDPFGSIPGIKVPKASNHQLAKLGAALDGAEGEAGSEEVADAK